MLPGRVTVLNIPLSANQQTTINCPQYTTHFMIQMRAGVAFKIRFGESTDYFSARAGAIYYERDIRYSGQMQVEPASDDVLEGIFWSAQ